MASRVGVVLAAGLFWLVLRLGVRGVLPGAVVSLLAPLACIGLVVASWRCLRVAGVLGERPLFTRHGFWLVCVLALLTLPGLGSFGLIDPWESHYAEVAREMLARKDFISPWWAHEGWFMSKPVLTFWLEALAMASLGVEHAPGAMLSDAAEPLRHPEWAVRLPGALCMLLAGYLLYKGLARALGRRFGFFSALVLATFSQWALATRHALTDTPYVAGLCASFGFLLLAWHQPNATVRRFQLRLGRIRFMLDAGWLLRLAVWGATLPQIALLLSRQLKLRLDGRPRLSFVPDVLQVGSYDNCGLPSQAACGPAALAYPWLSPVLQALVWACLLLALSRSVSRESNARRLLVLAAWFAAAIASMSKGPAGLLLPLSAAAALWVLEARAGTFASPRSALSYVLSGLRQAELARGLALFVLLVAPWYVAMLARHGRTFFDELVLKHMFGRAIEHLHDTNGGDDVSFRYYLGQLGYACFPWVALLPAALVSASVRHPLRPKRVQCVLDFSLIWLGITFFLFTFMRTKFHHYILPALPALACLVGVLLAERWGEPLALARRNVGAYALGAAGALLAVVLGCDLLLPIEREVPGAARLFHLLSYQYRRTWPVELDFRAPLLVFALLGAVLALGWGVSRPRLLIGVQLALAALCAAWLGHVYLPRLAPSFGQRAVIEAFYRSRASVAEPLIAYQMNWKGENFYTGNHLAIFVSSGHALGEYLKGCRAQGRSTLHFVLETARLGRLKSELGAVKSIVALSDRNDSDKFSLVRVELE